MTRDSCLGMNNIDLLVGVPNSLPLKGKTDFSFGISSLHFVFFTGILIESKQIFQDIFSFFTWHGLSILLANSLLLKCWIDRSKYSCSVTLILSYVMTGQAREVCLTGCCCLLMYQTIPCECSGRTACVPPTATGSLYGRVSLGPTWCVPAMHTHDQ